MGWKKTYESKVISVKEAASKINSGDKVWLGASASSPVDLINAVCDRYLELDNVNVYNCIALYPYEYLKPELKGHINSHTYFMGAVERKFKSLGNVEVASVHLSQLDKYIDRVEPNVLLAEVSEPDENGYMCHGPVGVAINPRAAEKAEKIIVQVNKHVPFIYGQQNTIHVSEVDYICEKDHAIPELPQAPVSEKDKKIASYILPLIPDGATIQIGLGGTANAVGYGLETKKDLGVHTEMLTDSMVYLAKKGVINCSKKNYNPGKMVISFGMGKTELYDFMDKNELIDIRPLKYVNNPVEVAKNDNFISINSALMVDLTGQVASESIGLKQFSGTGGQLDFVRGAVMSEGGKSFLTLASTVKTKTGIESRIKLALPTGTVVTTPRTDVQFVVTEYGVADLYCMSIPTRVKALINIAHPDFREELKNQAIEAGLIKE